MGPMTSPANLPAETHGTLPEGCHLTPLRIIPGELGEIRHCMKLGDPGYAGFGEVYFSSVNSGVIKGWKKHHAMTLNLAVISGSIQFVLHDDRPDSATHGAFFSITLDRDNYFRLTIAPGLWMAFRGVGEALNLLVNVASLPHDPDEQTNVPLDDARFAAYVWS